MQNIISGLNSNPIVDDTRKIHSHDCVFFALPGKHSDNSLLHAETAASLGVKRIIAWKHICEKLAPLYPQTKFIPSYNPHYDYAFYCKQEFYPAKKHIFIAVTGTKGKTSTAFAAHIMLQDSLYIGTLGVYLRGVKIQDASLTTPKAIDFYQVLGKNDARYVVFEYSSIALDSYRVIEEIDLAIFTNFTPDDHLIYHITPENYHACKKLLKARQILASKQWADSLGMDSSSKDTTDKAEGDKNLHISTYTGRSFQEANKDLAFRACELLGHTVPATDVAIPGRMELINQINGRQIIVDYAHTPISLEKALLEFPGKNIILVFGCGGDRDKQKRPTMGNIALKYAKYSIITDDNPRFEDPDSIRKDITASLDRELFIDYQSIAEADLSNRQSKISKSNAAHYWMEIPDRAQAIEWAILLLKDLDNGVLLITGKGPDEYQLIGDIKYPFSEKTITSNILTKITNTEQL